MNIQSGLKEAIYKKGAFMEYSPKKIKENLEKENFNLKKKFGQNFIIDENIIDSIINKA